MKETKSPHTGTIRRHRKAARAASERHSTASRSPLRLHSIRLLSRAEKPSWALSIWRSNPLFSASFLPKCQRSLECRICQPFRSPRAGPPCIPIGCSFTPFRRQKGVKVSIMLEEIGLPYEAHVVDFSKNDQDTPEFRSLNPN